MATTTTTTQPGGAPAAPALRPRTQRSWFVDDSAALVTWLQRQAFAAIPSRAPTEAARLRNAHGQLVVIFWSGAVLAPGRHLPQTIALLHRYGGII